MEAAFSALVAASILLSMAQDDASIRAKALVQAERAAIVTLAALQNWDGDNRPVRCSAFVDLEKRVAVACGRTQGL